MGPYSIAEYPIVSAAFLCLSVKPLLVPPDPSTQILMPRARPTAYEAVELDLMPNFRRGLTAIAHHRSTRADRYPTATFGIQVPLQLLAARLSTHPAQSRHFMNVGQVSSHQGTWKPIQVQNLTRHVGAAPMRVHRYLRKRPRPRIFGRS